MRYTTAIDITEVPAVWRSQSASRLYLYACMKCGYHDNDRDYLDISLRQMVMGTGLTLSAVRCALQLLQKAKLLTRQGEGWMVTKWIPETTPSKREVAKAKSKGPDYEAIIEETAKANRQAEIDNKYLEQRRDILRRASIEQLEQLTSLVKEHGSWSWCGQVWKSASEISVFVGSKKRSAKN